MEDTRYCAGLGRIADGVDAVRTAARDELRKGAHHIKVMASGGVASPTDRIDSTQYSVAELIAAVEEAQAANRYVAAHAYSARAINKALRQASGRSSTATSSTTRAWRCSASTTPSSSRHW